MRLNLDIMIRGQKMIADLLQYAPPTIKYLKVPAAVVCAAGMVSAAIALMQQSQERAQWPCR